MTAFGRGTPFFYLISRKTKAPVCTGAFPTRQDSNLRPTESESVALSSWATGRYFVHTVLYHKQGEL